MFRIVAYLLWQCQLRCAFCWVDELGILRTPQEHTWQEWAEALVRAAYGRPTVVDFVGGEPLLFDGFHDLCSELAKERVYWAVTTNAIATDVVNQFTQRYVGNCVCWNVSLQPDSPADQVVENVKALRATPYAVNLNIVQYADAPVIDGAGAAQFHVNYIPYQDWRKTDGDPAAVDGKRRIVYGKTRQEAAGKLAALQQQARECGTLPAPAKHTLAELLDVWLEAKSPHWRPRTLADYRDICERYIRPALGRIHLSKLTPDRIARLLAAYRDQPRTALKVYRLLSQALGLAVRWGWLAHNPCQRVDAPNYRPKRKELWTPEHLRTFLCEAEGHWLWPLWVLAIATGCRLGELLALEWSDVDWCAGTLSISKSAQCIGGEWVTTSPKTQAGERIIALPAKALAALAAQHLQQSEWRAQRQSWPAEGPKTAGNGLRSTIVRHASSNASSFVRP